MREFQIDAHFDAARCVINYSGNGVCFVIRMFAEVGGQHHRPHFHAYAGDLAAVFSVDTIEMIGGSMTQRDQRLIEAWAELHRDELLRDWELLQGGKSPAKIAPLC